MAKIDYEVKLYVVGPFDLSIQMEPQGPTLKEILQNLELPFDRIEFIPETQDVSKYLHKAKVLVFTSISEAFSMTMTEAGVYGIPIVAHYFPGIEDIIDLFAAQQIKLKERIQKLEHQLTIEQNKVSKNPASKKHFRLFKLKD